MRKIIKKLKERPHNERRNVLHLITFIFAIIVILIWIYSLSTLNTVQIEDTKMREDFKDLGNVIMDDYNNIFDNNSLEENQNISNEYEEFRNEEEYDFSNPNQYQYNYENTEQYNQNDMQLYNDENINIVN